MDINIKITVESPHIMATILALAEALPKVNLGTGFSQGIEDNVEVKEVQPNVEEATKEKESNENKEEGTEKTITLEEVRRVLAIKSKNGKQAEVKELIKKYGVNKLTDIHPCNYKELLELAEVI
ncbi:hypothetical protein [Clostridium celatum]|uniref:hypothetical protein n=1 Tax=Clostridium celatum TaxID=36834 RepID=UPI0028FFFC6E|nr:hypothetical protein [Clostridium celatum]MDU2265228.1 hypothetical protein [Clostridium celatum]MDU6295954.1 hypothetical protein [Clostridium celatum]